eukprot:scaffold59403_cov22-Prasinocladus_malaysianus.AAC.1
MAIEYIPYQCSWDFLSIHALHSASTNHPILMLHVYQTIEFADSIYQPYVDSNMYSMQSAGTAMMACTTDPKAGHD